MAVHLVGKPNNADVTCPRLSAVLLLQVFHCVHFECPAERGALEDYERTKSVDPVNLSLSALPAQPPTASGAHSLQNC